MKNLLIFCAILCVVNHVTAQVAGFIGGSERFEIHYKPDQISTQSRITNKVSLITETNGQFEMYQNRTRIAQFDDISELPDVILSEDGILEHFETSVVVSSGDTIEIGNYVTAFEHTDLGVLLVSYPDATVIGIDLATSEIVLDGYFGRNPITRIAGAASYGFLYIGQGRIAIMFDVNDTTGLPTGFFNIPEEAENYWFSEGIDKDDLVGGVYPPVENGVGVFDTIDGNYDSRVILYSSDYLDRLVELSPIDPFWMQRLGYLPWNEYTRSDDTPFPTMYIDQSRVDDPFFKYGTLNLACRGNLSTRHNAMYEGIFRIDIENRWLTPVWMIWDIEQDQTLQRLHVFPEVGLVSSAYFEENGAIVVDNYSMTDMQYVATDIPQGGGFSTRAFDLLPGSTAETREWVSYGGVGVQQLPNGQEYVGVVPFAFNQFGEVIWRGEDILFQDVSCNILETDDPTDVSHANSVAAEEKYPGSDTLLVLINHRNPFYYRIVAYLMVRGQPVGRVLYGLTEKLSKQLARFEEYVNGQHDIDIRGDTISVFNNQDYSCSGLEFGEGVFATFDWHRTDTFTVEPFAWFRGGINGAMGSTDRRKPYGRWETFINAGAGGDGVYNDAMYLYVETPDGGHEAIMQGGVRNSIGFNGVEPEFFPTDHVGMGDTSQILIIDVDFVVIDSMMQDNEMWFLFFADTANWELPAGVWCINYDDADYLRPIWIRASDARMGYPLFLFRKDPLRPNDAGGLHTVFKNTRTVLGLGVPTTVRENEALEIGAYPNPSSGRLMLKTSFYEGFSYRVFDITGQIVAVGETNAHSTQISLQAPGGTYYVQALSRRGRIANGTIVIVR